jgi:asparagine synthase (glutamine-hydrolysing)
MEDILPPEITWRRDKTGFETPQRLWMQDPVLQEYIHEAKRSLVNSGILDGRVLQKKIQPQEVHAAENHDWRYLVTAACIKSH